MESVNLGETHQNEDISKTKSNCAKGCNFCEMRTFVQANFCGAFYPSPQRSRLCQENRHDLILHQPCFFNPQFLHPHVYDNGFQNYCCNHDLNQNSKSNIKDKAVHECCHIRRMVTPHIFCEKMKIREKNSISDPESNDSHSKEPKDTKEHEWNYRGCNCGESLPWTSSPFIVPVVSYCVLWNSQNDSCSSSCSQMENLNRTNPSELSKAESNEKFNKQDAESELDDEKRKKENQMKQTDKCNKSSSSIVSLNSSQGENKICNIKKESSCPSIKDGFDINSEGEVSVLQIKSSSSQGHFSTKSTEKVLPNNAEYHVIFSAENESQRSSITGSEFDLKAEDSSVEVEELVELDDKVKCIGVASEENNLISPKISLETFEKNSLEETDMEAGEPCSLKSTAAPKRLIKNFTMTSRTEKPFQEKSQISAAGGDLGGNTCSVFRANLEYEENQIENVCQNVEAQNLEIKRISLNGLEEKKSVKVSGIARLIQDKKTRGSKNIKSEVNCNDETRKCCPKDAQVREGAFKFLKISPKIVRQVKAGSEKQKTETVLNSKKKGKKFPAPRIRPHNCERNSRK